MLLVVLVLVVVVVGVVVWGRRAASCVVHFQQAKGVEPKDYFQPAGHIPFFFRAIITFCDTFMPEVINQFICPLDAQSLTTRAENDAKKLGVISPELELGDSQWYNRMNILLKSIRTESHLTFFGKLSASSTTQTMLLNRILMNNILKEKPQILSQKIKKPIFILGLPRTGSTYLQRLLSSDPLSQSLCLWEGFRPSPPPSEWAEIEKYPLNCQERKKKSPRFKKNQMEMGFFNQIGEFCQKVHETKSDEPEEDLVLLGPSFASIQNCCTHPCHDFFHHLEKTTRKEWNEVLENHKKQLQILQWQRGMGKEEKREGEETWWVLKSPCHILCGELLSLLESYPDATFVWTHRHPKDMLSSALSLVANFHSMSTNEVNIDEIGKVWTEKYVTGVLESLELRKKLSNNYQFIDISYKDLVQNPRSVIEKIYAARETKISDTFSNIFNDILKHYKKGKHGTHKYSLDSFALDSEKVNQKFAYYLQFCEENQIKL